MIGTAKQGRRAKERARKQAEILEAARELFEKKGIETVKIQDISKRSGYSVGTIYLYFQSKEDIFCALASHGAAEIDRLITEALGQTGALGNAEIRSLTIRFVEALTQYGVYFDVLNILSLQHGEKQIRKVLSRTHELQLLRYSVRTFKTARNYFGSRIYPDTQKRISTSDARKMALVYWTMVLGLAGIWVGQRRQLLRFLGVGPEPLLDYVASVFSGEGPQIALEVRDARK